MIRNSLRNTMLATSMIAMAAADKGAGSNAPAVPPVPAPPAVPSATGAVAGKPTKVKAEVFGIVSDVAIPAGGGSSSKSSYPFDALTVGQSFGVKGRDKKSFNSIIYMAHNRHAVDVIDPTTNTPVTERKTIKGKDGAADTFEIVNKKVRTREFVAHDVDPATDVQGASVRIFRTK